MIYRFLDAGRFKRILYLVDRTSLGDQTMDTFKEVKLKELPLYSGPVKVLAIPPFGASSNNGPLEGQG